MDCPNCLQTQGNDQTQFCSGCGFPLKNSHEKATRPKRKSSLTPKQKGIRQGAILILLSLLLIPAYILLAPLFPANDRLVESAVSDTPFEKISQTILFTLFILGVVRIVYALLFQGGANSGEDLGDAEPSQSKSSSFSLPHAPSAPVSGFGSWRSDSGELAQSSTRSRHSSNSPE